MTLKIAFNLLYPRIVEVERVRVLVIFILLFKSGDVADPVAPAPTDIICPRNPEFTQKLSWPPFESRIFFIKNPKIFDPYYTYKWTMRRKGNRSILRESNHSSIEFPKYSFGEDSYEVELLFIQISKNESLLFKCYFEIVEEPPLPVILGGSYRTHPDSNIIFLDGSKSINKNEFDNSGLTFNWTCRQDKSEFCKNQIESTKENLTIPKEHVKFGDRIIVVLELKTSSNKFATTTLTVDVIYANSTLLQIVQNAPNRLAVFCLQNCEGLDDSNFFWTVADFSQTGLKFSFLPEKFIPGHYLITVSLNNTTLEGRAQLGVTFLPPPAVDLCSIRPQEGFSLETEFTLLCGYEDETGHHYTLSTPKGEIIVTGPSPYIFEQSFLLPEMQNLTLIVSVSSTKGSSTYVTISSPTVKISEGSLQKLRSIFEDNVNSMETGDTMRKVKTLQAIQAVAQQLHFFQNKSNVISEVSEDLTYRFISYLRRINIATVEEVLHISTSFFYLSSTKIVTWNLTMDYFISAVFKDLALRSLEMFKNERFPLGLFDKASQICSTLLGKLKIIEYNHTLTNERISLNLNLSIQDPDYEDSTDTKYLQIVDMLDQISNNIINISSTCTELLALTVASGGDIAEFQEKNFNLIIAKDHSANAFAGSNIALVFGKTLSKSFQILISEIQKDLMWWNPKGIQIATSLFNVEFWNSTNQLVHNFQDPVEILLKITKGEDDETFSDEIEVPNYRSLSNQDLNSYIKVYRASLPKGMALRVKFYNLTSSDIFDAVFTGSKYPTVEDFVYPRTIRKSNRTFLQFINRNDADIWCYLAVIPNKLMSSHKILKTNFTVGFKASACLRWQTLKHRWEIAHKPGPTFAESYLNCYCQNFSIIAGYLQTVEVQPQSHPLKPNYRVELKVFYVIYVFVAVSFGAYCLLLILATFQRKNCFYYLSDNVKDCLYGYLVVVRTSWIFGSGTTSNVTMKIYGNLGASEPHVLNYPDPDLRILQTNNEDKFILTTKISLGEITRIDLWCNPLERSPFWRCNQIIVYDLQKLVQWQFNVDTEFNISKTFATITAGEELRMTQWKKIKISSTYHTWNFWKMELNFSLAKRLTVIFSNVLLTLVILMIRYGGPSMNAKDVLDKNKTNPDHYFPMVVITSVISFLLHLLIVCIFRLSQVQFSAYKQLDVPFGFRATVVSWCFLVGLITFSINYLVYCGIWWPNSASLNYLNSVFFGVLLQIILLENIVILARSFLFKNYVKPYKIGQQLKHILANIEIQKKYLYDTFGSFLLLSYLQHLYFPSKSRNEKESKMILKAQKATKSQLRDLFSFLPYMVFMLILVFIDKDPFMVRNKENLEEMVQGVRSRTLNFYEIENFLDIYDYINDTLLQIIHPENSEGLMIDSANTLIGTVRLKQHRDREKNCKIPQSMKFLNISCLERATFGPGPDLRFIEFRENRLSDIWQYKRGYTAYIGYKLYNSYVNLLNLLQALWIDEETKILTIDFQTFNPYYSTSSFVSLRYEKSVTGLITTAVNVQSSRVLVPQNQVFFFLAVASFIFWQILSIFNHCSSGWKKILAYFFFDALLVALNLIYFVLYFKKYSFVSNYLELFRKMKSYQFLDGSELVFFQYLEQFFSGLTIFFITVRLCKFLQFNQKITIMSYALISALTEALAHTFYFFWVISIFLLTSGSGIITKIFARKSGSIKEDFSFYFIAFLVTIKIISFLYIPIVVTIYRKTQEEYISSPDLQSKAGKIKKELVYQKKAKFYYAKCLIMPEVKLKIMGVVAASVVCRIEGRLEKNEDSFDFRWFKGWKRGRKAKISFYKGGCLMEEEKIDQIRDVVKLILKTEEINTTEEREDNNAKN